MCPFRGPHTFTCFPKAATEQLDVACLHEDVLCSADGLDRMYTVSSHPDIGCDVLTAHHVSSCYYYLLPIWAASRAYTPYIHTRRETCELISLGVYLLYLLALY